VLMMWLRMIVGCVLLCAPPPPVFEMAMPTPDAVVELKYWLLPSPSPARPVNEAGVVSP